VNHGSAQQRVSETGPNQIEPCLPTEGCRRETLGLLNAVCRYLDEPSTSGMLLLYQLPYTARQVEMQKDMKLTRANILFSLTELKPRGRFINQPECFPTVHLGEINFYPGMSCYAFAYFVLAAFSKR